MKRLIAACLMFIGLVSFITPAFAMELWDPHLRGVNEGLAAGLVPPKGFYFINNSYFAPHWNIYDGNADKTRNHLDAFIDVPILLWSPGVKFLGADYAFAVAQPFDYTSVTIPGDGVNAGGSQGGLYNTVIVPFILSWKLPYHFHIAPSLGIYLNDGTSAPSDSALAPGLISRGHNGLLEAASSNGYYTFEPGVGITWMFAGWNLSADFHVDFNLKNQDTGYLSGNEFWADYTATKTIGKWTFGVGAYQQNQFTNDKLHGDVVDVAGYGKGKKDANFGIGPILGYNFGPVDVMATYNFNVYTKNSPGGDFFNLRLVIPFKS